jgi:hypothetical protein
MWLQESCEVGCESQNVYCDLPPSGPEPGVVLARSAGVSQSREGVHALIFRRHFSAGETPPGLPARRQR